MHVDGALWSSCNVRITADEPQILDGPLADVESIAISALAGGGRGGSRGEGFLSAGVVSLNAKDDYGAAPPFLATLRASGRSR